jgi:hypothetical protein
MRTSAKAGPVWNGAGEPGNLGGGRAPDRDELAVVADKGEGGWTAVQRGRDTGADSGGGVMAMEEA